MTKYTPAKEYAHLPRVRNPKSGAVHLVKEEGMATFCGHPVPAHWTLVDQVMITCRECLQEDIKSLLEDDLYWDADYDWDDMDYMDYDEDGIEIEITPEVSIWV